MIMLIAAKLDDVARCALIALVLSLAPFGAAAEPIKLKFAFFTSDRSLIYDAAIKPFVEAVNAEAKGLLEIEVFFSGALGKDPAQDLTVRSGNADIALIVPGLAPERFPDNAIIEMPGLYRGIREATLVYTGLVAEKRLQGYEDYFVIGAFVTEPESIHTRPAIAKLDDLKGKTIRANNPIKAAALDRLGMQGVLMPVTQTLEAISSGKLDGAAVPPAPLFEFGIGRVATYHYFLQVGGAPMAIIMKREKFESLPPRAQEIIRKYSGDWTGERFVSIFDSLNKALMEQLKSDPNRKVIFPSRADLERAQTVFSAMIEEWAARNPHNRQLFDAVRSQIMRVPPA